MLILPCRAVDAVDAVLSCAVLCAATCGAGRKQEHMLIWYRAPSLALPATQILGDNNSLQLT